MSELVNAGVYAIRNAVNGKQYVGSSQNLRKRRGAHFAFLRRGTHPNVHLQRSYDKHGADAFEWAILELVEDNDILIAREQCAMDMLEPEYNICPVAANTRGRKFTEATKAKMSAAKKGRSLSEEHRWKIGEASAAHWATEEYRQKHRDACRGQRRTVETRKKQSESGKAAWTRRHRAVSEDQRRKISDSLKAYWVRKRRAVVDK